MGDTDPMDRADVFALLRSGTLDPQLTALLWLLTEDSVPLMVVGDADRETHSGVAAAILSLDPAREWLVIDGSTDLLTAERLVSLLRGGVALGMTIPAAGLSDAMQRLVAGGLPEDGVRRLGVVLVVDRMEAGLRCVAAHYLRPAERDGQGHVQRRPPAVLAAWDREGDTYEHYAWAITPELADRVDRSQADFEERLRERAVFLGAAAADDADTDQQAERRLRLLASEPPRQAAPLRPPAAPSSFRGGLTDPDPHRH